MSDQPALEAQVLASSYLDRPRALIVAHPETDLSEEQVRALDEMVERLLLREPLAYITGRAEFYGLEFAVSPAVLIPRPETELTIDHALLWLRTNPNRRKAADAGTGSGCIAVTLAKHVPGLHVRATDTSDAALQVAHRNVETHGVGEQVRLLQTYLLEGVPGPLDLVCANLPYIPTAKLDELEVARHEPRPALDGGPDGLALIGELLESLPGKLAPGGLALLEIEAGQGETAPALARKHFPEAGVSVLHDLAGHPRLLRIETPEED